jgi:hypothetical protein
VILTVTAEEFGCCCGALEVEKGNPPLLDVKESGFVDGKEGNEKSLLLN